MYYGSPWFLSPDIRADSKIDGIWAYRYKGHFYRTTLRGHADPYNTGQHLANQIPRDSGERENWIKRVITLIEAELSWRVKQGIAIQDAVYPEVDKTKRSSRSSLIDIVLDHPTEDRTRVPFMDMLPDHDLDWLSPTSWTKRWTYVIDLEDRAFTINGVLHFSFDRMPDDIPECLLRAGPCTTYYRMTPKAEVLHSTFVQRWPPLLQRPSENQVNGYSTISPIVTNLEEWGTRGWDDLNASEALSVHLAVTILHDHSTQIRNPDFIGDRRVFAYCQWQLLTAAAPAVTSSSLPTPPDSCPLHPSIDITLDAGNNSDPKISFHIMQGNLEKAGLGDFVMPPMWFRGCLVKLCYRLDTPEFVNAEVYQMAQALKTRHRSEGLGLIFDGRNVVGVALDNTCVRHSPALPIYNHQLRLMDGFRLVMHLLSPCVLSEKTPWRPSTPQPRSHIALPMEIVVRITQFLDSETYDILPLVSYSFRQLYFTYPRIGNAILLQPTQSGAFHVFDTVEQQKYWPFLCRHSFSPPKSGFGFYHRQNKLCPTFFTPEEYAEWRDESEEAIARRFDEKWTLRSPMLAHIFRLSLKVTDRNTPHTDELAIPERVDVSMQIVWGAWTLEKISASQDDRAWYRYHVEGFEAWPNEQGDPDA